MTEYAFIIPGLPVAQPRQRTRQMPGGYSQNYTPTKAPVNVYKAQVQSQWLNSVGVDHPPLEGPIHLDILFVMPRPSGMMWKKKPMPRAWHRSKPDDDNMEKAVRDALTKLAFRDDSQICSKRVWKVIAAGDEMARTEILIVELDHDPKPEEMLNVSKRRTARKA